MELTVEVDVAGKKLDIRRCFADQRVERDDQAAKRRHIVGILGPLGCQPGGGAFEHAAHFDRVPDVLDRELAGDEASGRPGLQKALLGQPVQHQPQRRPRDVQPRGQWHLSEPFTWPERTSKHELPHLEESAKGLGFEAGAALGQDRTCFCDRNRSTAISLHARTEMMGHSSAELVIESDRSGWPS